MLLATKLMLEWLGEVDKAQRLESAIKNVIANGEVRTYDMGGQSTTIDMAEAVREKL